MSLNAYALMMIVSVATKKMEASKILKIALELESKGYEIYSNAIKDTKNPILKDLFSFLSKEEKVHMKDIKDFVDKHKITLQDNNDITIKDFFHDKIITMKQNLQLSENDIDIYENALQFEIDAYEFYKEKLDEDLDSDAKKLLEFLMKQENMHYKLLLNSYNYIKDPVHFNSSQEDWLFEG